MEADIPEEKKQARLRRWIARYEREDEAQKGKGPGREGPV